MKYYLLDIKQEFGGTPFNYALRSFPLNHLSIIQNPKQLLDICNIDHNQGIMLAAPEDLDDFQLPAITIDRLKSAARIRAENTFRSIFGEKFIAEYYTHLIAPFNKHAANTAVHVKETNFAKIAIIFDEYSITDRRITRKSRDHVIGQQFINGEK